MVPPLRCVQASNRACAAMPGLSTSSSTTLRAPSSVAEGAAGAEQAILRIEAGDGERQGLPRIGRRLWRRRRRGGVGAREHGAAASTDAQRAVHAARGASSDDHDQREDRERAEFHASAQHKPERASPAFPIGQPSPVAALHC